MCMNLLILSKILEIVTKLLPKVGSARYCFLIWIFVPVLKLLCAVNQIQRITVKLFTNIRSIFNTT